MITEKLIRTVAEMYSQRDQMKRDFPGVCDEHVPSAKVMISTKAELEGTSTLEAMIDIAKRCDNPIVTGILVVAYMELSEGGAK